MNGILGRALFVVLRGDIGLPSSALWHTYPVIRGSKYLGKNLTFPCSLPYESEISLLLVSLFFSYNTEDRIQAIVNARQELHSQPCQAVFGLFCNICRLGDIDGTSTKPQKCLGILSD